MLEVTFALNDSPSNIYFDKFYLLSNYIEEGIYFTQDGWFLKILGEYLLYLLYILWFTIELSLLWL